MVEWLNNSLFEFDKNFSICLPLEGRPKSIDFERGQIVIGTDEAGRGPGAGGVFASAVYFPNLTNELIEKLSKLNDSKKLSKKIREELYDIILENTINSTICIEVEEIEKINILNASLKAMKLACEDVINQIQRCKDANTRSRVGLLSHQQEIIVLVDGNKVIKDFPPSPEFLRLASSPRTSPSPLKGEGKSAHFSINQQTIIKGDSKSASIAAASILAKVSRDRYMDELHEKFPQYNWQKNAGYLTAEHLEAIEKYGITPYHRKSFLKGRNTKQLSLLN